MSEAKTLERGCGYRPQDSLYLCVETSPFGVPIEYFLVDPVVSWSGEQLRAPMFVEDSKEVLHIILGIGSTYYPFVSDFVEEARRYGVSKRVPLNFQVERLTPDKSKFLLVHPRAIPRFPYEAPDQCPKKNDHEHECIGALWSLSALKDFGKVHALKDKSDYSRLILTPSCLYLVEKPAKPTEFIDKYSAGIILAFPLNICKFEYVNRKGLAPSKVKEKLEKAKFRLDVVPE